MRNYVKIQQLMTIPIMAPLIDRYIEAIRSLPPKSEYTKSDICTDAFLVPPHGRIEMFYAPFDSVNREAKLAIVGLTPGFQQMEIGVRVARGALLQGHSAAEACVLAKQAASFAGMMRRNLITMLDGIGIPQGLGIRGSIELFGNSYNLVHTTSAIRYPVFSGGENYTGYNPSMLDHKFLRSYIFEVLAQELPAVSEALIVPLGKAVDEAIGALVSDKRLNRERCLQGFPHPSYYRYAQGKRLYEQNRQSLLARVSEWFHRGIRTTAPSGQHDQEKAEITIASPPIVEAVPERRTASSSKQGNRFDERDLFNDAAVWEGRHMADYVQYHNQKKMGRAMDITELRVVTKRSSPCSNGDRVWLLTGEGSPCKYYLRLWFTADSIRSAREAEFSTEIVGTRGRFFDPMLRIDDEPWFAEFKEKMGNFAFGLTPITNPNVIRGLELVAGLTT